MAAPVLKPPLKYRGGKSRELARLLPLAPKKFSRYVEPFFGGGAMFFARCPSPAVISDINSPLMNFYRDLRDNFAQLQQEITQLCELYARNREIYVQRRAASGYESEKGCPNLGIMDDNETLYYRLRAQYNGQTKPEYRAATLYYFINRTCYNGMIRFNSKGHFNVPYGRYKSLGMSNITAAHAAALKSSELHTQDYKRTFATLNENDFVFLDPPYDTTFHDYGNRVAGHEFDAEAHRELAATLKEIPARYLLVVSATALTEELYAGQIRARYPKRYAVNIRNRFQASAEHLVITNY